jgi:hypothetical protein
MSALWVTMTSSIPPDQLPRTYKGFRLFVDVVAFLLPSIPGAMLTGCSMWRKQSELPRGVPGVLPLDLKNNP